MLRGAQKCSDIRCAAAVRTFRIENPIRHRITVQVNLATCSAEPSFNGPRYDLLRSASASFKPWHTNERLRINRIIRTRIFPSACMTARWNARSYESERLRVSATVNLFTTGLPTTLAKATPFHPETRGQ